MNAYNLKLAVFGLILSGILILVALSKVTWPQAVEGITVIGGFLVVALGIKVSGDTQAAATIAVASSTPSALAGAPGTIVPTVPVTPAAMQDARKVVAA